MSHKSRRPARQAVIQALYSMDVGNCTLEEAVEGFHELPHLDSELKEYAKECLRGILARREEIDATLSRFLVDWEIGRLSVTDRAVLELSVYELMHRPDIPAIVSVSEAVEIAKKFGSAESGKFVNGVLASILRGPAKYRLDSPAPEESPEESPPAEPTDPETKEIRVEEGSQEVNELERVSKWLIRTEEP